MGLFNLVWFVCAGWWGALVWLALSAFFAITIIGLPIAKACYQFAILNAFPYGKEVIKETKLKGVEQVSSARRIGGIIINIIWFPIGIIATISYLIAGLICFVTVIGIPVGVVLVRMGKFVLFPIGSKVVSKKQAYASAVANELERRSR